MGLLSQGTPLPWSDARKYAHHVRKHGIQQFLATYHANKCVGRRGALKWGDEVEYMLVHFDQASKNATLSLRGYDVLTELMRDEEEAIKHGRHVDLLWRPEYARYMLEGTPGLPYGLQAVELLKVEENMRLRRQTAEQLLHDNEFLASITVFPRLGSRDGAPFLTPHADMSTDAVRAQAAPASTSLFIPDAAINPHPRFRTLTQNIRERRGAKVAINLPIYRDVKTPSPFRDPVVAAAGVYGKSPDGICPPATAENQIYMDCMCFGMGCSCLQLTLQASHMCEARRLYDQLGVVAPIMLALTAASPVFRGYLADVDCRWNVIAGAVDDRTPAERGLAPPTPYTVSAWDGKQYVPTQVTPRRIPKSRYDSISTYLSTTADARYNDLDLVIDADIEARLRKDGVDPLLARHLAHLFIRDPLVLYRELLDQDDSVAMDHFENIQSTNWQTMRFKPPPTAHPDLGWRVEFRSMEAQLTDFENAAFSVFIVLLSRVILCLDLDLYLPLSLVDKNMQTAQTRDAVLTGKFWFRHAGVYDPARNAPAAAAECCRRSCRAEGDVSRATSDDEDNAPVRPASAPVKNGTPPVPVPADDCPGCATFAPRSRSNSPLRRLVETASTAASAAASATSTPPRSPSPASVDGDSAAPATWSLLSMDEIINGNSAGVLGLVPLVRMFLDTLEVPVDVRTRVDAYLQLIADRAAGKVATNANWLRQQYMAHPDYKQDSVVTPKMVYDVLLKARQVTKEDVPVRVTPVRF
ncbi:hypothetical protein GGF32_003910 [Allomyces javanicus]|nr:hypothetical protein GGF32_003910 [Allomyces javanicus]